VPTPSGPELIASFLGSQGSADDPRANVVLADYSGFPPLYINAGSGEALLDDARALDRLARESGVNSTLSVVEGMQHVFIMLAGRASEADDEIRRIAEWFSRLV
jgi:monoterpene epsilon-lactone hydrolase